MALCRALRDTGLPHPVLAEILLSIHNRIIGFFTYPVGIESSIVIIKRTLTVVIWKLVNPFFLHGVDVSQYWEHVD
ncbi:hypothetical protein ASC74_03330 [Pseudomonas sp. Root329]|nr:hypothetical protein ASC74_03330 [Pseudomonas sp. Root329]